MDSDIVGHLLEIKALQAAVATKVEAIEKAVDGNGQPGLKQRVEALEGSHNRTVGASAVLGALSGFVAHYLGFHR